MPQYRRLGSYDEEGDGGFGQPTPPPAPAYQPPPAAAPPQPPQGGAVPGSEPPPRRPWGVTPGATPPPPQPRQARTEYVDPAATAAYPPVPRHVARRDEPVVTRRRYAEVSEPKAKDPSSEGTKALGLAVGGALLGTFCCAPFGLAAIVWSLVLVFNLRQHYTESGVGMPTKLVLTIIVNAAGILGTLGSALMLALYTASA